MRVCIAAAVVAWSLVACQQDQTHAPVLSETRDSAGIQVVENPRPADDSRLPWRIGPEPSVSIGALEGAEPYMLFRAFDATKLADGRIVVANVGTNELRVFDASGTHLASWGGEGEGPGEFTYLRSVEPWPGDSIVAWHAPRFGISVFDAQGNYSRTLTFVQDDATPPMQWFWPESAKRDGTILAAHSPEGGDTVAVQLRDGEGEVRSSFGTHPGREPYIYGEGDRSMLFWSIFGREPVWATWGDLTVVGNTGRYEVRAFGADGSLARIVRRDHIPRPPTQGDVAAYIEQRVASNIRATESEKAQSRRRYQTVPVAEHFPAFESIMSDALDHLWVEEYKFPGEERPGTLWTVFDPRGKVLGFVETPEGLWIFEIGEDYILGRSLDELSVEYVELWPLERL